MRRPGFLGDLDGFWFSGFGLVYESHPKPVELRYGRDLPSGDELAALREAELTRQSRAQGWLTTGPVKQHWQLPVASPSKEGERHVWEPFDFENGLY